MKLSLEETIVVNIVISYYILSYCHYVVLMAKLLLLITASTVYLIYAAKQISVLYSMIPRTHLGQTVICGL